MGKTGIAIGIVLIILAIVGGLIAYSYSQIHVSLNDVSYHSIDWVSFSWPVLLNVGLNVLSGNWLGAAFDLIQGINLDLEFGLYNGGLLPVYIPDLSYDLFVNGVPVGTGHSKVNITINPGQTKEITVLQNFQKSSLAPAVGYIVSNDGVIDLKVKGTAHFKLFVLDIPIPFESSKSISIKDEIRNRLNNEIQKHKPAPVKTITSSVKSLVDRLDGNVTDLDLRLPGTIIDSTYRVGSGAYRYVSFSSSCVVNVQGGFIANAALGDDIKVYLLNQNQFNGYQNGENVSTYYNSGKVEYGTFDVTLNPDEYYIVMSNNHSTFSTKTVQLEVAANCR